jgi:hypothetical protein
VVDIYEKEAALNEHEFIVATIIIVMPPSSRIAEWLVSRLLNPLCIGSDAGGTTWSTRLPC